jgi:alpha-galactosidase
MKGTSMSQEAFSCIYIGSEKTQVRYHSGTCIFDEALIAKRWVGRNWSCNGFVEAERNLTWVNDSAKMPRAFAGLDLDVASFELVIDGQKLHSGWELVEIRQEREADGSHAVVELRSSLRPVTLRVHTRACGNGFLIRWLEIQNTGTSAAALGTCSVLSGVLQRGGNWRQQSHGVATPFRVGFMASRAWGEEGFFDWLDLPNTPVRLESRNGKSGHSCPWFILENRLTGERFLGCLAWSANWAIELTAEYTRGEASVHVRMGPTAEEPQRVIDAGETITTPVVHMGMFQLQLDALIQQWHRHIRQNVLARTPAANRGLLLYNHWSYLQHDMSEDLLRMEIDAAVAVGAEVFIVDAGWYADQGTSWYDTVGDWRPGNRLPNGFKPISDYAHAKGLKIGAWFDIERLSPKSRTHQEHPDWVLKCYGEPMVFDDIDLTNPRALEYCESILSQCIEEFELDVFRLDYNAWAACGGQTPRHGWQENVLWRQHQSLHGMYERLRRKYPKLLMENCSGGGGRLDLAMMAIFDHSSASDHPVAPRAGKIINGLTMVLPPERVAHHLGVAMDGHTRGDVDFQLRIGLMSHLSLSGIYPRISEANPLHVGRIRHHVELFKNFVRPYLYDSVVYHHTPVLPGTEPGGFWVQEHSSPDRARAMAGVFRLAGGSQSQYHLRLRSLDPGRQYCVTFDNSGQSANFSGKELLFGGITIDLDHPLSSELLLIQAT